MTTNRVAQAAGVSIGTLYEYFPHKQALADTLVGRHLAAGEALVAARVSRPRYDACPTVAEKVSEIVAGFLSLHREDPLLHRRLT